MSLSSLLRPRAALFALTLLIAPACGDTGTSGGGSTSGGASASGGNAGGNSGARGGASFGGGAGASSDSSVVARWGDREITMGEVQEAAQAELLRVAMQEDQITRTTMDGLIDDALLEAAAQAAGKTPEEYLRDEVFADIQDPTDAEVQAFYDQNARRINRPLEDVRAQVVDVLRRRSQVEGEQALIDQLRSDAGVEVLLPPFRVEVTTGDNPPKGNPEAAVTIVEWSDFQCPYCVRVNPTMDRIFDEYGDDVVLYFRDFPLPGHREAPKASEAARCAAEQDKFWEMHDHLFANQSALSAALRQLPQTGGQAARNELAATTFKGYATELGLDADAFNTCLDSGRHADAVVADKEAGGMVGVSGTPGFFINGRFVNGAQPYEVFKAIIDEELGRG